MSSPVLARLLGGLLCAAAAFAFSAPSFALSDEPAQRTEDVSNDEEVSPPSSSDDISEDRSSEPDGSSLRDPDGAQDRSSAAPSVRPQPSRAERADPEAAKRALLSDPKKEKPNPLLDTRGPDYYDRRAKELLKDDNDKGRVDLHPLMEAHPESYVIVCTAGCPSGESAQIVSLLPKRNATPLPGAAPNADALEISCVGGCGNGNSASFPSAPKPYSADKPVAATVGEWMTTVAQAPAGAEAPAPKSAASGDWMDKINRDRAVAKAQAVQQAAVETDPARAPKASKPSSAPKANEPASAPKAIEPAPATKVDAKPSAPAAVTPVKTAEEKSVVEAAKPVVEAKPVAIAQATPSVSADAKPAALAETKPAAAPVEAKAPVVNEVKPLPPVATKTVAAEAKRETPPVAKPAIAAEAKPNAPSAPTVTDAKPAAVVETKPAAIVAAKPLPPVESAPAITAQTKTEVATPAPVALSQPPQQIAALETPKTPAALPAKPATQDAMAPMVKPEAKVPAPAPVASQKPADVKVTPTQETKVAAVEPPAVEKPAPVAPSAPKERVISVLSEDKEMNAAIEKARGTLAAFWKSYDAPAPGEADHALKVAVAGNGTTEHFWLTRIKRDGGKLSGVISNQPQSVKSVRVGQRYEFTADMISDWTFKRNGKLVGNETMRVLLPRMPEEQASVYRQMYETP
ncbi:MAG: DUF2314 domain-containing protein [Hyphomicrobium sp.]|nr:DUF2314 domain-containing protein [Hyphomicrobium sp.]